MVGGVKYGERSGQLALTRFQSNADVWLLCLILIIVSYQKTVTRRCHTSICIMMVDIVEYGERSVQPGLKLENSPVQTHNFFILIHIF